MKTILPWAIALVLSCAAWNSSANAVAPPNVGRARVAALVERMDDNRFSVRQNADRALRRMGRRAVPILQQELAAATSVEVQKRLRHIIHDLTVDQRMPDLMRRLADGAAHEAAAWELRRYGKAIVPLLKKELKPGLPGDQRQRVEKIIAELSTPARR
jgi:hypothetical protein